MILLQLDGAEGERERLSFFVRFRVEFARENITVEYFPHKIVA